MSPSFEVRQGVTVGALIETLKNLDPTLRIQDAALVLLNKPTVPEGVSRINSYDEVGLTEEEALCGLTVVQGSPLPWAYGFGYLINPDYLSEGDKFVIRKRGSNIMFLGKTAIDGFKHPSREEPLSGDYINVYLSAFDYPPYCNTTIYREDGWEFLISEETWKQVNMNIALSRKQEALRAAEAELEKAVIRVERAKLKVDQLKQN